MLINAANQSRTRIKREREMFQRDCATNAGAEYLAIVIPWDLHIRTLREKIKRHEKFSAVFQEK